MEFPDDFTELGAAITDTDSVLINKRYTTFARIKTWVLALVGTSSGTLAAGNDSRFTDSRAPTGSAGGSLTGTYPNPTIAAGAVSNAMLRDSAGTSIVGRASGTTGAVADITAAADDSVLARVGGSLSFYQVATNMIATSAVTAAKIADGVITGTKLANLTIPITKLDTGLQAVLQKLGSAGSYLSSIQTVSTASATVTADVDLVLVTYTGGTCALTFGDATAFPVGRSCVVQKTNTSAYGITVQGSGSDTVNGGTAGAAMTLPNSTTPSSTTTTDPTYLVQRTGSTDLRVS